MSTDERMERIEGQLARIRWINRCLIACIVLSLGVWFIRETFTPETAAEQSDVKVIRANGFILEDENGKIHADLTVFNRGPRLSLYDKKGNTRAKLYVGMSGPSLSLSDEPNLEMRNKDGNTRASLTVYDNGPSLSLYDENGWGGVGLVFSNERGPSLSMMYENRGMFGAMLSVRKDGPCLSLDSENGKGAASLRVHDPLGPCLSLHSENGKELYDDVKSKAGAMLTVIGHEPMLGLTDENGRMIWSAP